MNSANPQPSPFDLQLMRSKSDQQESSRGRGSGRFNIDAIQGVVGEAKINRFSFSDIADPFDFVKVNLESKHTSRMLFEDAADRIARKSQNKGGRVQRVASQHKQESSLGSQLTQSQQSRLNSSQEMLATMTCASTKRSTIRSYNPSKDLSSSMNSKASAYPNGLQTSREGELFEIKLQDFDFERSVRLSYDAKAPVFGPEPTKAFCSVCDKTVLTSISLQLPTLSL